MSVTIVATGAEQVIAALEVFKLSKQRAILSNAARKALAPIVKTARSVLPTAGSGSSGLNSGNYKKSIGVKQVSVRKTGPNQIVLLVGPRPNKFKWTDSKGKVRDPYFYGIPVEYGHVTNGVKVPAIPAMRIAYEKHKNEAITVFTAALWSKISLELQKRARVH